MNSTRRLPTYEFKLPLENDRQRNSRHSLSVPLLPLVNDSFNNKSNSIIPVSKTILKIPISNYEKIITNEKIALIPFSSIISSPQKRSKSDDLTINRRNVKSIVAKNSHSMTRLSFIMAQI